MAGRGVGARAVLAGAILYPPSVGQMQLVLSVCSWEAQGLGRADGRSSSTWAGAASPLPRLSPEATLLPRTRSVTIETSQDKDPFKFQNQRYSYRL